MLVTDRKLSGGVEALVAAVDAAVAAGVNAVQLREKGLPLEELLALAHRLRKVTAGRALLLLNAPLEVALACGADGVHLPEAAPTVERPGGAFVIGRSVHSAEAGARASAEAVDYIIAGPVFETPSHADISPAGLELIETVAAAAAGIPVLAIGGINATRIGDVLRAGAFGVAVISAILAAPSPADATRELRQVLGRGGLATHPFSPAHKAGQP
jgi:thiamine-phosphate pyrophosphorylase